MSAFKAKKVSHPATIVIEMDEAWAEELANYLSGTDMHMSIGDRVSLARVLYKALKED